MVQTEVQIESIEHFWIPLPDGTRLSARMWRPITAEAQPVPAILEYIPYRKNDGTALRDSNRQPILAQAGYAVVRVDVRGTGESDGFITDEYTPQELQDGCDVIAWLAAQSWCTGKIGMTGKSWGGFNCLQVAALRPPALKAIMPFAFTDNRYTDDVHYLGGCVLASEMLSWASIMLADLPIPPDPRLVGDAWREKWMARLEQQTPWVERWLEHQTFDNYWQHGSISVDYDAIEVPVYAVCGLSDGYPNSVLRVLENLKVPRKGLLGPWGHVYPSRGYPAPAIGFLQEAIRWWDRWLKDEANGIDNEPMLTTWMLDSMPPQSGYDERLGRWVTDETWPSSAVDYVDYAVFKDPPNDPSASEPERSDEFWLGSVSTLQTFGVDGGQWWGYGREGQLPGNQQTADGESLSFTSDMLEHPIDILGFPKVKLRLKSDQYIGAVAVRLCDVRPDGESVLISYGVLNLTHRKPVEWPDPITPGEQMEVNIKLNVAAYSLPAGHRLRLSISNTYWPLVWPTPEVSIIKIYRYDCSLSLPLRTPQDSDLRWITEDRFGPAVLAESIPLETLREGENRREWSTDLRGRKFYTRTDDEGRIKFLDHGLEKEAKAVEVYSILPDDPLSGRVEIIHEEEVERGDWRVTIKTVSRMSCDADNFYVENRLTTFENDKQVFDRSWEKAIERNLL
ncbi:MAG: CocE/NonD family hydrolase [Chloroflexota bacterium]